MLSAILSLQAGTPANDNKNASFLLLRQVENPSHKSGQKKAENPSRKWGQKKAENPSRKWGQKKAR